MNKWIGLKLTCLFLVIISVGGLLLGCFERKVVEEEKPEIIVSQKDDKENNNEQLNEYKGVSVGDEAYDFSLLDREGNEIKLSALKGKVIFINFFTTWCSFCKQEMPHIQEVYDQYKDKDIVILAVDVLAAEKVDIEGVNKFIDELGYTFPILYDVDGTISVRYNVSALPTTYIIDKEGFIADFIEGAMDKKTMVEKIENVLNR